MDSIQEKDVITDILSTQPENKQEVVVNTAGVQEEVVKGTTGLDKEVM